MTRSGAWKCRKHRKHWVITENTIEWTENTNNSEENTFLVLDIDVIHILTKYYKSRLHIEEVMAIFLTIKY